MVLIVSNLFNINFKILCLLRCFLSHWNGECYQTHIICSNSWFSESPVGIESKPKRLACSQFFPWSRCVHFLKSHQTGPLCVCFSLCPSCVIKTAHTRLCTWTHVNLHACVRMVWTKKGGAQESGFQRSSPAGFPRLGLGTSGLGHSPPGIPGLGFSG